MSDKEFTTVKPDSQGQFSARERFQFDCHSDLACFNNCCRDINIFLSPYDVLRIAKQLNLAPRDFLRRHTIKWQPGGQDAKRAGFPMVLIKMQGEDNLKCPFVTANGCQIYEERPWACRMAPLEVRGPDSYGFIFDADKCLGLLEPRQWTVSGWMQHQGSHQYVQIEKGLEQIPTQVQLSGFKELDEKIRDLVFMACYQLDAFREYVFNSDFLQVFDVPASVVIEMQNDDVALLQFGLHWLTRDFNLRQALRIQGQVFGD